MSVYQLTIEPGTAFHGAYQRGAFELPSEDDGAALFETTQEMLAAAGIDSTQQGEFHEPTQSKKPTICSQRVYHCGTADRAVTHPAADRARPADVC